MAAQFVLDDMTALLAPRQLGFGVKRGVEAAVHAARSYLNHLHPDGAMVKLDFCNAFNTVRHDKMLEATEVLLQKCILSFIPRTLLRPPSFWKVESFNLLKGYSKVTRWAPVVLPLNTPSYFVSHVQVLCLLPE